MPRPSDWSLLARTVVFHLNSSSPISHSSRSLTPRAPYQIPGMVNVSFVKIFPTLSYVCCILFCIAYLLSRSVQVDFWYDLCQRSVPYSRKFSPGKDFSYQLHHLLSLVNLWIFEKFYSVVIFHWNATAVGQAKFLSKENFRLYCIQKAQNITQCYQVNLVTKQSKQGTHGTA